MPVMEKMGLEAARTERLLKQEEFAELAGVSRSTIVRIERDGGTILMLTAQKMLRALNKRGEELGLSRLGLEDVDWQISQ